MPKRLLFFLMLWVIWASAFGQKVAEQLQKPPYVYLHLDQEDGLASNHVLAILQDKKGFLWIGTNNGLQRFDGREFIHFRHNPHNLKSLSSDIVERLFEDKEGNIWIASASTATLFNPATQEFFQVPLPESMRKRGGGAGFFQQDEQEQIWLLSSSNKSLLYNANQKAFVPVSEEPSLVDRNQELLPLLEQWNSHEAYVFLRDSRGIVWAGSEKLLALYPGASTFRLIPQQITSRYGIAYNRIFCLAEDREGTIWVGTDKGLYYFNPDKQRFFSAPLPLFQQSDSIPLIPTDFLQTQKEEIWVSTLNRGILTYDNQFNLVNHFPLKDNQQQNSLPLWCLVEDKRGNVWAGSQKGLLLKIDKEDRLSYLRPAQLAGQTFTKAALDASGTIWFGTDQGQVFHFNSEEEKLVCLPFRESGEGLGRIIRILPEQEPFLWVATSRGGIYKMNKHTAAVVDQYSTSSKSFQLLSNEVGDMQWADSSTLAVSTIAGLHFINTRQKTGKTFTTSEGLPANALINVINAGNGDFFVTPQNSLSRWNLKTGHKTTFSARDGLTNDPYVFCASYRLADGRIVLGSMNGFFYFHPDSMQESSAPADVLITGLRVFDKPVFLDSAIARDGNLLLHHSQNFFTIEYVSLNYYDDKRITYSYQLEGVDRGWVEAGTNRFANYTNIAGGSYRFKVKAKRDDGVVTVQEASLAIHISEPFYKALWFRSLLLFVFVGVGLGLYRTRINRLLALQNMRVQISRDLHDDMGSTLSTINILSAMARQQVEKNTSQTAVHLEKISDYSQRMMETMDDIVWSINPLNDAGQNLLARMRSFCSELLEPKGITFTFEFDEAATSLRLTLAMKHNCFMIFKEAINNAAKYSHCQSIQISIKLLPRKQLFISINDNGIGFDPTLAGEGNGLLNMQARAKAIKGSLQILSNKNQGTTVILQAPISK